ncbi:Pimelyl-[acyl-carrier protein] methyl ester esterase [Legionella massiliensis]|uniref:Pimeloyl-[acyl-carrier protein] methyl ester esterase n=1 Tax=Legionella massiliensis TaxID=1034943 RepID=A0A078L2U3_9GAMM|nr:alpha/beta fold hydrolase [Legionella massiliensis]CDZ78414.1 Pimelyl-[acyl-carrier protein] methyl ester esterase [Legionella massiliensis]CEE14152.1 Pimeloyl-[acyl-carrier protein] methyl ester esterase [Legionella massiliensis]
MNLHIEIKGQGFPLVLFHGWGFDHRIWLDLASALAKDYQLYLVDLPGFGMSPLMSWEKFKEKLLRQLPPDFAIAGWSMGGLFATRLALEEQQRVSHLVNIASSPRFIKEKSWPGVDKAIFDNFFRNLAIDPGETISQFVTLQLGKQPNRYQNQHMPETASLKAGLDILASWDLREELHQFKKPACFMFGRLDAITPRVTMTAMQKMYPTFDYVMFNKAAHMPFLSHQDEFLTILEQFFNETLFHNRH